MTFTHFLVWLQDSALGAAARDWQWLWPTFESLHFIGLCVLFGSLLVVDLRILGLGKRLVSIESVMPFIPLALAGGVVNLVTGFTFFCGYPYRYWSNPAFLWKMGLFVFGGLNAIGFEILERRKLMLLPVGEDAGLPAKVVAAMSLATWTLVIILGRLLPYTGNGDG